MASFTPVRGTRDEISHTSMVDGQFLFETDQNDFNRIYADCTDANGDLVRVQVGGDRGDDNRLAVLKDVTLTNPTNNNYLRYNGTVWVNDTTLSQKVVNLTTAGRLSGQYVDYDSTKNVIQAIDSKLGVPDNVDTNSYLFYNGSEWVGDTTITNKVQRLDNDGYISGSFVRYDATTDVNTKINTKITMPTAGQVGDSLVLGVGNVAQWKKVQVDVVDSLDSTSATDPLSANQGRNLKGFIDDLTTQIGTKIDKPANAGTAGQVLGLDNLGKTVWKTVGGGGSAASDWTEVENKPFDVINDQTTSSTNPDFDTKVEVLPGGTVKVLYLNDALVYRPTDTEEIASNKNPEFMPCSIASSGAQVKKKISWTGLVQRIKDTFFNLSASIATGDVAVWDGTRWKNDSTIKDKIFTVDDETIKATTSGSDTVISVPIDESTIVVNGTSDKLEVPIDASSIVVNSTSHKLEVPFDDATIKKSNNKFGVDLDGKTIKQDSTNKVHVNIDGETIISDSTDNDKVKVPIDETTIILDDDKVQVPYDDKTLNVGTDGFEVNLDGTSLVYDTTNDCVKVNQQQIVGTIAADNLTVTFTSTTVFGGTDNWIIDIYCSDGARYVKSQTVAGNVLTVEFDAEITGTTKTVVCHATKGLWT